MNPAGGFGYGMNNQPVMQPRQWAQQNLQSMIPQSNIIWIDDYSQIAQFPTGYGWQQWFGLKNDQVMFVRETDMNGVMQPIRRVRYELDNMPEQNVQNPVPVQTQMQAQTQAQTQGNGAVQAAVNQEPAQVSGVTRAEFDNLAKSVQTMTEKLSDLLK